MLGELERKRLSRVLLAAVLAAGLAVPAAWAQPAFVGVATGNNGEGSTTLTLPVPSGATGDLLLAVVGVEVNPSTPTPAGWTAVPNFTGFNGAICASGDGAGIRCQLSAFWKIASSASEGSVSWIFGPNPRSAAGAILRYSGIDATSPIAQTADQNGTGTTLTAPSVTTTEASTRVVRVGLADATQSRALLSSPPATARFSVGSANNLNSVTEAVVLAGSDAAQASAGATGTATFTSGSSEQWVAGTIVLRPPAPPPTTGVTIFASVGGNTADCYPMLKREPPICKGDGKGDNHNDQLPAVPKFVSAVANGSESSGNGSKGKARIHVEFDISRLAGKKIRYAAVYLTTHRGTVDQAKTYWYYVTREGNGTLEDADYQSPATAISGAVMPVPPTSTLPVGDSGSFRFRVTNQLRDAVKRGRDFFSVQGRLKLRRRVPATPLIRGLEVYSTCSCSSKREWPVLRVVVEN